MNPKCLNVCCAAVFVATNYMTVSDAIAEAHKGLIVTIADSPYGNYSDDGSNRGSDSKSGESKDFETEQCEQYNRLLGAQEDCSKKDEQ